MYAFIIGRFSFECFTLKSETEYYYDSYSVEIMSQGNVITCRAAVCWEKGDELKIEEIQVEPPSRNEVRVKIITTSLVCFLI